MTDEEEIRVAIPTLKWESAKPDETMTHFTGRSPRWLVQLVVLDDGKRMGSATRSGWQVVALTDEVCAQAERCARAYFEAGKFGRDAHLESM